MTLLVTNLERSLLDCIRRPNHSPSLNEFFFICENIQKEIDVDKLLYYSFQIDIRSVFHRLGFLLDKNKKKWNISDEFIRKIHAKTQNKKIDWSISTKNLKSVEATFDHNKDFESSKDYFLKWKIHFHQKHF